MVVVNVTLPLVKNGFGLIGVIAVAFAPSFSAASSITLADITSVDALGYECVSGEYFEETEDSAAIAFSISKKIRLPRICLPDPCERALTRRELSNLTGTEIILARFEDEWDEYYARYAEHCRKETTDIGSGETPVTDDTFWDPFTETPPLVGTVSTTSPTPPLIVPTSGSTTPNSPSDYVPPEIVLDDFFDNDPDDNDDDTSPTDDGTDPTTDPDTPSVVPLPASWALLASALALFVRRRRTNA